MRNQDASEHQKCEVMKNLIKKTRVRICEIINPSLKINFGGRCTFEIPLIGRTGLAHQSDEEPWMSRILETLFQTRDGTFIDVGMNIGQTLLRVKSLDQSVSYIGFEPNPACVEYVQKLFHANRLTNVLICPFGLSSEPGLKSLELVGSSDVDASASLIPNFRPTKEVKRTMKVPVMPFSVLRDDDHPNKVSVIKVDVEGGELEVFEALREILTKERPPVLFEVLPARAADDPRAARQASLMALIRELGYRVLRINKKNPEDIDSFTEFEEFPIHSDHKNCDYLAVLR